MTMPRRRAVGDGQSEVRSPHPPVKTELLGTLVLTELRALLPGALRDVQVAARAVPGLRRPHPQQGGRRLQPGTIDLRGGFPAPSGLTEHHAVKTQCGPVRY
jgi:hypothetical protein